MPSILLKDIIYTIPMFIIGFIVKLQYEKEYSIIFLIIAFA